MTIWVKGWYSLSSPVWANFGKKRGLPVSCFGSNIGDNIESYSFTQAEVGEMSKMGGGTSGYFGNIRGRGLRLLIMDTHLARFTL